MTFDSRYQDEKNGPLKKDLRDRLRRFRSFLTLAEIGDMLKFSGPFISQLLNDSNPARIDSKHIDRVVRAIEEGEVKHAKKLGLNRPPPQNGSTPHPAPDEKQGLDYHLAAIDALGWKITGLQRKD